MAAPPPDDNDVDTVICVAICGHGLIGKELERQIAAQKRYFVERLRAAVRVVAVANSKRAVALAAPRSQAGGGGSDGGASPPCLTAAADGGSAWRAALQQGGQVHGADVLPASEFGALGAHARRCALAGAWLVDERRGPQPAAAAAAAAVAIVVDCTAADAPADLYAEWIRAGAHVVAANKRMGSGPAPRHAALLALLRSPQPPAAAAAVAEAAANEFFGRQGGGAAAPPSPPSPCTLPAPRFLYEATVGAGLPVLSTLRALLETGDEVRSIEGVLSGTLSFIFNSFSPAPSGAAAATDDGDDERRRLRGTHSPPNGGAAAAGPAARLLFSAVVALAKEKGLTEPDPREDLSGADVARKAVILAREAGLTGLELSDVGSSSSSAGGGGGGSDGSADDADDAGLVPAALSQASGASAEDFMRGLPAALDDAMARRAAAAAAAGKVLRYAAKVDLAAGAGGGGGGKASAGVAEYPADHPFASLRGSENVVRFVTKRYPDGLVVRGPGAGAAVTAAGVLADVLAVGRSAGRVLN